MHGRSQKAGLRPYIQGEGHVPHSCMLCITEHSVQNCFRLHVLRYFEQWMVAISMDMMQVRLIEA